MLTRRIARPLLAGIFISGGIDTFRNPGPRAQRVEPVTKRFSDTLPLADDTEKLVPLNAAAHGVAGTTPAPRELPRRAAVAGVAAGGRRVRHRRRRRPGGGHAHRAAAAQGQRLDCEDPRLLHRPSPLAPLLAMAHGPRNRAVSLVRRKPAGGVGAGG